MNKKTQAEHWKQTSKPKDSVEYHKGYLAKDRYKDPEVRDVGNFFRTLAEMGVVNLFQKRISYASGHKDPVFQYIAQKI